MLRKPIFSMAVAVFFWGLLQAQTAQAGDDIWDMMNPAWWADKFDDDDDDWDYWRYGPDSYYHGGPYGWGYPPYPGYPYPPQQAPKKKQPDPLPIPE
jgi:hypothetical protein